MSVFEACKSIGSKEAAERAGLHLKKRGGKHWASCFLHEDKTPSLAIYEDGGWHCFSCNNGGDAVKLYELLYNLQPMAAAQQLASAFGLSEAPQTAPKRVVNPATIAREIDTIKWRRVSRLLDIKHAASKRIREIEEGKTTLTDADMDKVFAQVARKSAAEDLIERIELLAGDDLKDWVLKGGKIDDL